MVVVIVVALPVPSVLHNAAVIDSDANVGHSWQSRVGSAGCVGGLGRPQHSRSWAPPALPLRLLRAALVAPVVGVQLALLHALVLLHVATVLLT